MQRHALWPAPLLDDVTFVEGTELERVIFLPNFVTGDGIDVLTKKYQGNQVEL